MGNDSLQPTYNKDDIIVMVNYPNEMINEGDLVVFAIEEYYVIHRIIDVYNCKNKCDPMYLTIGDHFRGDDPDVYNQNFMWLQREEILGRPYFKIPRIKPWLDGIYESWKNTTRTKLQDLRDFTNLTTIITKEYFQGLYNDYYKDIKEL